MFEDEKIEKANYMGKIRWSRTSGGKRNLYGTEIRTDHPISLEIYESSVSRELSRNWYHTNKEIIRIELSPIQWAEFLTSGNTEGIPCTIVSRECKRMDEVPQTEMIEQFAQESQEHFEDFEKGADKLYNQVKEAFESGKPMGKKQMEDLMRSIKLYKENTVANIKYVRNTFAKDMDAIVTKAKAEVNAYVENKALELGMEILKDSIQIGIENKD